MSTVNSKEKLINDYDERLIKNYQIWNNYDKYKIDDIGNWLIRDDFIGMKDHCYTLFMVFIHWNWWWINGIHILNQLMELYLSDHDWQKNI